MIVCQSIILLSRAITVLGAVSGERSMKMTESKEWIDVGGAPFAYRELELLDD